MFAESGKITRIRRNISYTMQGCSVVFRRVSSDRPPDRPTAQIFLRDAFDLQGRFEAQVHEGTMCDRWSLATELEQRRRFLKQKKMLLRTPSEPRLCFCLPDFDDSAFQQPPSLVLIISSQRAGRLSDVLALFVFSSPSLTLLLLSYPFQALPSVRPSVRPTER